MKSFDYHHPNEATAYRSFFIGLQLFSALFTLTFYVQAKYLALAMIGGIILTSHFFYWLYRPLFIRFAKIWIRVSTKLSHIITPIILSLFYYLILTPYGFIYRLVERRKNTTWHVSESDLRFKDPF